MTPEQQACQQIDAKLVAAGWIIQDYKAFTLVPKTLIFTKDNYHADDIACFCHEVFDKCNDFCKKIIYRKTEILERLREHLNSSVSGAS